MPALANRVLPLLYREEGGLAADGGCGDSVEHVDSAGDGIHPTGLSGS
jgi:hypothetical protein